jgi:hypothetical protein
MPPKRRAEFCNSGMSIAHCDNSQHCRLGEGIPAAMGVKVLIDPWIPSGVVHSDKNSQAFSLFACLDGGRDSGFTFRTAR